MIDDALDHADPSTETGEHEAIWEEASIMERAIGEAERARSTRHAAYDLPTITPLAEFADYQSARTKRAELATAASAIGAELAATQTAIARGFAALREDETTRQARDLIAGRSSEAFQGFEELRVRVARLTQQSVAYGEAVRMQDEIVATIRSERSIDAAEAMQGAHKSAVAAIAEAIAQLRVAFDREEAARLAVKRAGYDARLPSFVQYGLLGTGSQLDRIEEQARHYGR